MRGRVPGHDFVEPMILKILKESRVSMSALAINYRVNEAAGRTINLNVIRNNLILLVKNKKISESLDKENDVIYYKLITI
jgi:Fe2+ or Zn2+ uptake regulation protein